MAFIFSSRYQKLVGNKDYVIQNFKDTFIGIYFVYFDLKVYLIFLNYFRYKTLQGNFEGKVD